MFIKIPEKLLINSAKKKPLLIKAQGKRTPRQI